MPSRIAFTQAAVERLKPPAAGRAVHWDTLLPGFGLRVAAPRKGSREARKTWIAMYRVDGKPVWETIGTLAAIPKVEDARQRARVSFAKAKGGANPVEERRAEKVRREAEAAATETAKVQAEEGRFEVAARRFLAERGQAGGWSPKYANEVRRIIEHDVLPKWRDKQISEITDRDVKALLWEKAGGRERRRKGATGGAAMQANRTLTRLRTLFAWAKAEKLVADDPTLGIAPLTKEKARDRVLCGDEAGHKDDDEIVWLWRGADAAGWPLGPIFKLLLLTAQREGEVAGMRWSELDLKAGMWTLPKERTKSERAHVVHLSALACEILEFGAEDRRRPHLPVPRGDRDQQLLEAEGAARRGDDEAEARGHR